MQPNSPSHPKSSSSSADSEVQGEREKLGSKLKHLFLTNLDVK